MLRCLLALAVLVSGQEKDFGKPYVVKVQAKTRWSTSFKKADFDKELKKHDDCLREKGRQEVPEDLAGWDEWTFEAAESWKFDIQLFERIFGKHIVLRKYSIDIEGTVTMDAQKSYWVLHPASGTKMRLANRPKLAKDKVDPPNVRAQIEAALKAGKKRFRVSGEIIRDPTNVILLAAAEPLEEEEKDK